MTRTAIVAGASGLTGQALVKHLLGQARTQRIVTLERRLTKPLGANHQPLQVGYANLGALPACDDAYCCLGTTIKKAGSRAAFREVDFDAVVAFARRAHEAGAKQFLVVSAMGASPRSSIFYNRIKGEMEAAVATVGFDAVHIFQPSFLVGERAERRIGERIGIAAFSLISPLMVGSARKYRPIHVETVATAMVKAAASGKTGVNRYESDVIEAMA